MNQTQIKIAIIVMPIIVYITSGWGITGIMSYMMNNSMMPFNPISFATPIIHFIFLGIAIYYSIQLWIKYIEN